MNRQRIKTAQELHDLWWAGEVGGVRADFRGEDLRETNFTEVDLPDANFVGTNSYGVNFSNGNFSGANFTGATLPECVGIGADFSGVIFKEANLFRGNFTGGIFNGADFRGAFAVGAIFRGASFRDCIGNGKEIKSLFISGRYSITYTSDILQIGCENHAIADWWEFSDDDIDAMSGRALVFWNEYEDIIRNVIEASPAVPTGV